MKKFFLIFAPALLLATLGFCAPPSLTQIREFGGIDTDTNALFQKKTTPDSQNVRTDVGPGILPRQGLVDFSTEASSGLWTFNHSNGSRYLITKTSNTLRATTGSGTFATTISTVPFSGRLGVAQLGDRLYFVNATDGLKYWNSTTVTVASAALKCTDLVSHRSRLWAIGKAGSERTIFVSAFDDGTDWVLDTNPTATDPAQYIIGFGADEILTDIYGPFQGQLVWFRNNSFGVISGYDRTDFTPDIVSREVGTAYPESVRDCDGLLRWLGPKRTVWEFDGKVFSPENEISRYKNGGGIRGLLASVSQGDASSAGYTITSQGDWGAGTVGAHLSSTTSPGDLVMAKASSETLVDSFADGDITSSPVWTSYDIRAGVSVAYSTTYGGLSISSTSTGIDPPMRGGAYTTTNISTGSWRCVFNLQSRTGSLIALKISTGVPFLTMDDSSQTNGYAVEIGDDELRILKLSSSGDATELFSDTVVLTYGLPASGYYNSMELSRDSAGLLQAWINGSFVGSATDASYTGFSYVSVEAQPSYVVGQGNVVFDNIYTNYAYTTYTAVAVNTNGISSWATTGGDYTSNNGRLVFAVYTDTDTSLSITNTATFTSSQTYTPGSLLTVATAAYFTPVVFYEQTATSGTPSVSMLSWGWTSGSALDVASLYTGQRYWLAVGISSTTNNRWLVFDRSRQWQLWTSPYAVTAACIYNSYPYFGTSGGGVWQLESGTTDDGTSITSYYTSPTLAPAGMNNLSTFHDLFMETEQSDATLQTAYYVNGSGSGYSLGNKVMNTTTGIQNFKLPFPFSQIQQGKTISFKWTVTSASSWRILASDLSFYADPYEP